MLLQNKTHVARAAQNLPRKGILDLFSVQTAMKCEALQESIIYTVAQLPAYSASYEQFPVKMELQNGTYNRINNFNIDYEI